MIKILVVDDDKNIRSILIRILSSMDNVNVVGDVDNGAEAVDKMEELDADAVFMDVDMPIINGIEAAKLILDIHPRCFIVFVTAHETYMPEAFEMYAFDYILKPFKIERVKKTIHKIQERYKDFSSITSEEPKLIENKILLKNNNGIAVLKPEEIIFISREDRNTIIHTEKGNYKSLESLSKLEDKLSSQDFIRSHKSYIVNFEKIDSIEPYGRWTYVLKFKGIKENALITKEKFDAILNKFKFKIN